MFFRVADDDAQRGIPAIGYRRKTRVKAFAEAGDDIGQRIAEILVLPTPETMPSHHYPAAEKAIYRIQLGQRIALFPSDEIRDHRTALSIEVFRRSLPIERLHPASNVPGRCDRPRFLNQCVQACASFSSSARLRSSATVNVGEGRDLLGRIGTGMDDAHVLHAMGPRAPSAF